VTFQWGNFFIVEGWELKFNKIKKYNLSFADWSFAEYAQAIRCIFSGKVNRGDNSTKLAIDLSGIFSPSTVYPVNSGRCAINIALLAFSRKKPERKDVIVPAYVCPSVIEIVRTSGFNPVLSDVGDDLNLSLAALPSVLTCNTLAVIAPHMYGCPARIDEIEKLCSASGIFLIDDAAQVIGIRHHGKMLGTFGDIGIISFAQSKSVVTGIGGSGGALLVNNPDFDVEIKLDHARLPSASHRLRMFFYFLWNCIWGNYTGNSGYYFARVREKLGVGQSAIQINSRISNLEAGIAIAQIDRLETMQKTRVDKIESYHQIAMNFTNIDFPQYAPGRYLARLMIALPISVNLEVLRSILKNNGINTRPGYSTYVVHHGQEDEKNLLEVPSGKKVGDLEAFEICAIISYALDALCCSEPVLE
jgi:dTDP-4-amino-4,6-dideoxygalactose transaminase